jgi:FtsP/CotA-like multicopper oxidase with cupredoxin domain
MNRREWLYAIRGSAGLWLGGSTLWTAACGDATNPTDPAAPDTPPPNGQPRLPISATATPTSLSLPARPGSVATADGGSVSGWFFRDALPGPTLRATSGDTVSMTLENGLSEETIVHWHGLDVPDDVDGHPRLAVGPGGTYGYQFTIQNRAGTYWYHPHPHRLTGGQTYRGLAGFFIVEDVEEAGLGLPGGAREVPLVIQDKRVDGSGQPVFTPSGPDLMAGYLGDTPFVNGAPFPFLDVDRALYRLRILNGSNARIYDLALSDGRPLVLIGNDGGLLDQADTLESIFLGPAERADVLVDFSGYQPGDRVTLQSRAFQISGGLGSGGGGGGQGQAMNLMDFVVGGAAAESVSLPTALASLPPVPPTAGAPAKSFEFTSRMGSHLINGRAFDVERVDAQVSLGIPERWQFINNSGMPHPVHMHAGQFRVLSRSGGRGQLFPWERGLKDTVLILPFESVEVAVHFQLYQGLYLLHCHNLEHEDAGMMLNFEVV